MNQPKEIRPDVPALLLKNMMNRKVRAKIVSTDAGVVAGIEEMERQAVALGLEVHVNCRSATKVVPESEVASLKGDPLQIVKGEDCLLGIISKASGIATAARQAVALAGNVQVVSGGWKKVPPGMKEYVREGLMAGGVGIRILPDPFVYLDKNYLRLFGSLESEINAARTFPGRSIVVQLRGETAEIGKEATRAARLGATAIMVDTGSIGDLRKCSLSLTQAGLRDRVKLVYGGGVQLSDLTELAKEDVDIVDVGRAILDAPLLDFRYDVLPDSTDKT